MPELPEVETIRQVLRKKILNKKINDVIINYSKVIKTDLKDFKTNLINQTINEINRYGKYLIFDLDDYYLISHLRMEGKYFVIPLEAPLDKHDHVIFVLNDNMHLRYNDVRKFGTMHLKNKDELFKGEPLEKLGLEPFSDNFSFSYLKEKLNNKKPIKASLLDQTIVAGLGNIYVNEVLFMAKINPSALSNTVNDDDISRIYDAIKTVLKRAIELGGTTIRSYYSDVAVTGRFQNELLVHSREGKTCPVCGTTIIKTRVAGRGTYLCPVCQRKD